VLAREQRPDRLFAIVPGQVAEQRGKPFARARGRPCALAPGEPRGYELVVGARHVPPGTAGRVSHDRNTRGIERQPGGNLVDRLSGAAIERRYQTATFAPDLRGRNARAPRTEHGGQVFRRIHDQPRTHDRRARLEEPAEHHASREQGGVLLRNDLLLDDRTRRQTRQGRSQPARIAIEVAVRRRPCAVLDRRWIDVPFESVRRDHPGAHQRPLLVPWLPGRAHVPPGLDASPREHLVDRPVLDAGGAARAEDVPPFLEENHDIRAAFERFRRRRRAEQLVRGGGEGFPIPQPLDGRRRGHVRSGPIPPRGRTCAGCGGDGHGQPARCSPEAPFTIPLHRLALSAKADPCCAVRWTIARDLRNALPLCHGASCGPRPATRQKRSKNWLWKSMPVWPEE
jgi:hypothetical protein